MVNNTFDTSKSPNLMVDDENIVQFYISSRELFLAGFRDIYDFLGKTSHFDAQNVKPQSQIDSSCMDGV